MEGRYLQLQAAACTLVNCNEMFAESSLFVAARLDDAAPLPPTNNYIFSYVEIPSPPLAPSLQPSTTTAPNTPSVLVCEPSDTHNWNRGIIMIKKRKEKRVCAVGVRRNAWWEKNVCVFYWFERITSYINHSKDKPAFPVCRCASSQLNAKLDAKM